MTAPRKPAKAAPRKRSSAKPAAKKAVRKPGPTNFAKLTGAESARLDATTADTRTLLDRVHAQAVGAAAPDGGITGSEILRRNRAFVGEAGQPLSTFGEIRPGAPHLCPDDLCAVQRLLDSGVFNDFDVAVAKVRKVRYGYDTPSVERVGMDLGRDDTADAVHLFLGPALHGDWGTGIAKQVEAASYTLPKTAAPTPNLQDELRILLDRIDGIGAQLDTVVDKLYPVLRRGLVSYAASINGPTDCTKAAADTVETPVSPATLRVRAAQRQLGVISALVFDIATQLDLPTMDMVGNSCGTKA